MGGASPRYDLPPSPVCGRDVIRTFSCNGRSARSRAALGQAGDEHVELSLDLRGAFELDVQTSFQLQQQLLVPMEALEHGFHDWLEQRRNQRQEFG